MRVLSVNVGHVTTLLIGDREVQSGIRKHPTPGPVRVGPLGLAGDHIGSTKHHGGPDQAVYLYSAEDYAWWAEQLGHTPEPGTFGENLTLSAFGTPHPRVGDRYRIGDVLLEVTAPRIPCATFAARMQDPAFVKKFREARRPGVYARVLQSGTLTLSASVTYEPGPADFPTTLDMFEAFYQKDVSPDILRHFLGAPIAARSRDAYEEQLAQHARS